VLALVVSAQYVILLNSSGPTQPDYGLLYYATALLLAVVSLPTAVAVLVLAAVLFAFRRASRHPD
jgi:hypothetical protein